MVFQLLDALETPLNLTTTIQQAVLAVVGIGFFITLVLAWYHGEKGRQRVSGPELLMVAALLVVAGGVLSLLPDGEEGPGPATDLVTEAMRGEGAHLVDRTGCRFMPEYDQRAELAPRDVVSWAIVSQMQKTQHPNVYLELTAVHDANGVYEMMVEAGCSAKMLYGTDLPWFDPHYVIACALFARISDEDRHNILHRNAERLLARWIGGEG